MKDSCIRNIWWCITIGGTRCRCIPHACGDGSHPPFSSCQSVPYSPRMWGWFSASIRMYDNNYIFPVYMGMFPRKQATRRLYLCFPHICGGASLYIGHDEKDFMYSPRMWGWFSDVDSDYLADTVFPMYTGMILFQQSSRLLMESIPLVYGDDSGGCHGKRQALACLLWLRSS